MVGESPDVSFFVPELGGGGAERVFCILANYFSERYNVDMVLVEKRGEYISELNKSVNVVGLGGRKTSLSLFKLKRYVEETTPDVVLSTTFMATYVGILTEQISDHSFKSIVRVPNVPSIHMDSWRPGRKYIYSDLIRKLYPKSEQIIAISEGVSEDLVENFGVSSDITTIYNPVNTKKIRALSSHPVEVVPFTTDSPVILAAGRLTEQKDFSTLIKAVSQMDNEVDLVILGEGEKRQELKSLSESIGLGSQTYFPGFVDNPYKYMSSADVFVLSSAWEGFGNVLVEAITCSTPVVSTDCKSGPREILDDGKYGGLVPVGDEEALASEIKHQLHHPTSQAKLKERAMDFSVDKIGKEYEQVMFGRHN